VTEDDVLAESVAFTPDNSTLIVGRSFGRGIDVMDKSDPTQPRTRLTYDCGAFCVLAVSPDGRTLAARCERTAQLWRRRGKEWVEAGLISGIAGRPWPLMGFSYTGARLFLVNGDDKHREVSTYDVSGDNPKKIASFEDHPERLTALAVSPGADILATADEAGQVRVWSATTGKTYYHWWFPGPVGYLAFAPDGYHLALGNSSGTVYILRLAKLQVRLKE
jgi:WD40 repeat protein